MAPALAANEGQALGSRRSLQDKCQANASSVTGLDDYQPKQPLTFIRRNR